MPLLLDLKQCQKETDQIEGSHYKSKQACRHTHTHTLSFIHLRIRSLPAPLNSRNSDLECASHINPGLQSFRASAKVPNRFPPVGQYLAKMAKKWAKAARQRFPVALQKINWHTGSPYSYWHIPGATVDYPLANDDSMEQTYPMTDAASGYCAFPSEREDPELGSADLGGVCAMALKYAGHRAAVGTECATQTACTHCNGVWCNGKVEALLQQAAGEPDEAASSDELPGDAFPLAKDDDKLHNWPMTDAADGFCAYPSERSDPTLGSAKLGAAPMSAEETEQVCDMARKYEGHRAEVGSECATKTACGGCNGVWCSGTMKALLQSAASEPDEAAGSDDLPGDAFPLAKDDDKLHNWPMTDAADGFCAYPSERSDPTLGSAELGAAPMSAEETEQVCDMARKYEGHRAEVGSECATKTACGGCNGVWCSGTMKCNLPLVSPMRLLAMTICLGMHSPWRRTMTSSTTGP